MTIGSGRVVIGIKITLAGIFDYANYVRTSTCRCWMDQRVRKVCNLQKFVKDLDGFLIRPQF